MIRKNKGTRRKKIKRMERKDVRANFILKWKGKIAKDIEVEKKEKKVLCRVSGSRRRRRRRRRRERRDKTTREKREGREKRERRERNKSKIKGAKGEGRKRKENGKRGTGRRN